MGSRFDRDKQVFRIAGMKVHFVKTYDGINPNWAYCYEIELADNKHVTIVSEAIANRLYKRTSTRPLKIGKGIHINFHKITFEMDICPICSNRGLCYRKHDDRHSYLIGCKRCYGKMIKHKSKDLGW
jgi:hypothetical protein